MPRVQILPCCAVLLALACATSRQPLEGSLESLRAREAGPLAPVEIAAEDGSFRTRTQGRSVLPLERDGETHYFGVDLGTAAPIACALHRDELDLAASLLVFSASSFEATAERLGAIEQKRISGVDAGAEGGAIFLGVDWLYGVRQQGELRVGQIKHLIGAKGDATLYCQHDEVGYPQSFRRVVLGLLAGLELAAAPAPAPYYREITLLSIGSMRIGFQRVELTRDAGGDVRIDQRAALVVPADESTLQASDSYAVELARPDGTLITQKHIEVENGEIASHLDLEPRAAGWSVRGSFQGKPLELELGAGPRPASSWLGEALALRRAIETQGVGAEVALSRWVPDADPTRLLDETIAIRERIDGDRFRGRMVVGGVEADIVADRSGSATSGTMKLGFIEMRFERIFAEGEL